MPCTAQRHFYFALANDLEGKFCGRYQARLAASTFTYTISNSWDSVVIAGHSMLLRRFTREVYGLRPASPSGNRGGRLPRDRHSQAGSNSLERDIPTNATEVVMGASRAPIALRKQASST